MENLDIEKLDKMRDEFIVEISKLVLSKGHSKEVFAGAVAAMADMAVLMACKMVGQKEAIEIVTLAVAHGFKVAVQCGEELGIRL